MASRVDGTATRENEMLTRVLDWFHLVGERPSSAKP
jgi:hypothetical protein